MNIHQLHSPDDIRASLQECIPCEASSHPETARYWPRVRMRRRQLPGMPDERLSIEISNPWPDLVLRHVKIAFLSASPNAHLKNGSPAVKFAPTHGIEFGDIAYGSNGAGNPSQGVVRDIIMIESQVSSEGRQIYAGVCFTACGKDGNVKHYGYLLFRSNFLASSAMLDMAA
ncbi:MAG: hypothetical protein R3E93_07930 [Thiothrix sp.]